MSMNQPLKSSIKQYAWSKNYSNWEACDETEDTQRTLIYNHYLK